MQMAHVTRILCDKTTLPSVYLGRTVTIDFYFPQQLKESTSVSLLLINDGQDLAKLAFAPMLENLYATDAVASPLLIAAIHCGPDRKNEYGVAGVPDFKGRGAKAGAYTSFVFEELIPFIRDEFEMMSFSEKAFAGFSLGGLSALDIVWHHPQEFSKVGVFSGSLWWRSVDQTAKKYDNQQHRIMHQQIRKGSFAPWLKFFFQCGSLDEKMDRNKNGVIDSIDDTLDLIKELVAKGYQRETAIRYVEIKNGTHSVETWFQALPIFLKWGWGDMTSELSH
ncbi:MAG: alpha/beta hydrolase-fold protein [Chitinophagaceae bacterium]|nr:esterase [Chitinophagaceae bacterium]